MPKSHKGNKFILCIMDEVTHFLISILIYHSRSEETGDALIENCNIKYCIPDYIIMDQYGPDIKVSGTLKYYYTLLNKSLQYWHKLLQEFRSKRLAMINKYG